jgi:hypothetical protein
MEADAKTWKDLIHALTGHEYYLKFSGNTTRSEKEEENKASHIEWWSNRLAKDWPPA